MKKKLKSIKNIKREIYWLTQNIPIYEKQIQCMT